VPLLDHMATPKHQGAIYYQVRVDADGQAHALLGFLGRAGAGAGGGRQGSCPGTRVHVSCRCPWTLGRGPAPASAPPSTAAFCAETSRGCLLLKAAMSEASTWSWRVVALAPWKKSLRGLKTRSAEADGGWSSAARATTLHHTGQSLGRTWIGQDARESRGEIQFEGL